MTEEAATNMPASDLLSLTVEIVSAHVANNRLANSELPDLIASVYAALEGLGAAPAEPVTTEPDRPVGAVSVRKSLADPNRIISMIDGKPYALLKRHIARHGMTPAQYRERFGLKPDYPMVAPAHAKKRRDVAKSIGLGRKPKAAEAPEPKTPARRRTLKVAIPA